MDTPTNNKTRPPSMIEDSDPESRVPSPESRPERFTVDRTRVTARKPLARVQIYTDVDADTRCKILTGSSYCLQTTHALFAGEQGLGLALFGSSKAEEVPYLLGPGHRLGHRLGLESPFHHHRITVSASARPEA